MIGRRGVITQTLIAASTILLLRFQSANHHRTYQPHAVISGVGL